MGDRGADHNERPTEDEVTRMGQLLEEALRAGAFGFSTSRTTKHRAADGRPTPSLSAEEPELAGIARAMKRAGTGVIQVNSDFGAGEFAIAARRRGTCPAAFVAAAGSDGYRAQSLERDARVVGRSLRRRARLYGAGRITPNRYPFGTAGLEASLSDPPPVALAGGARSQRPDRPYCQRSRLAPPPGRRSPG